MQTQQSKTDANLNYQERDRQRQIDRDRVKKNALIGENGAVKMGPGCGWGGERERERRAGTRHKAVTTHNTQQVFHFPK